MKHKKDMLLVVFLLAAALLLVALSRHAALPFSVPAATSAPEAEAEVPDTLRAAVAQYFEEYPAESYLLLTTASGTRTPIPLKADNAFRITQADGSENVVHIGKDSFYMESSNCENQNCVQQGVVDLDNRDSRVLLNMVICLPHNIRLELLTRAEAEEALRQMYALDGVPGAEEG